MSTLVMVPSRGRPQAAVELLRSFAETRKDAGSRLVFLVDADDPTRAAYPGEVTTVPPGGSLGNALRSAAANEALLGDATSVGMVGDDCRFRTEGWDRILDGWLTENIGIAWGDDGWDHPWPKEEKASHWWLSRPIVDAMGLCPPTQHFYMDDYWAQLGWAAGCARYFPDVLVEHLHPMAGKAVSDRTYTRARRFLTRDKRWWHAWHLDGKGREVRRLRAIAHPDEPLDPVRVFADWHHPALWEALSIVFEDRFGWQLYSPGGPGWKGHGWHFEDGTPGWKADDYLSLAGALDAGDHWELAEPEFTRLRKLVTVDQFESQPWDIIVASVGIHQRSFADIARRLGIRFVHQVGDARRKVERIPGQIILASSTVQGATVIHHQEFDTDVFGYTPPEDPAIVSSFMLRLDSTSGPYGWLAEAPGIEWSAVDCDSMRGPGYLVPMAKVAERMRASGWVWHDKRIGDGYGHVLFNAAAMGRPLIGHASHYRGQMGERLWEDGVTCIDLDRHPPEDVLRRLRIISSREHEEMGAAIRSRFDELVDFGAEAESIRAVLA